MGQQQLLLLVLATILVGVAVVAGIGMFQDSALNANIDSVTQENVSIASKASEWFNKSIALGGGGGSFLGNGGVDLQKLGHSTVGLATHDSSGVGEWDISAAALVLTITGTTAELDDAGAPRTATTTLTMNANGTASIATAVTAN